MTVTTNYPVILNDHGRVVKAEESLDGEGVVVEVREEADVTRWYYGYEGGCWKLNKDGTLGRQTAGTNDTEVPKNGPDLERYLQNAYLSD